MNFQPCASAVYQELGVPLPEIRLRRGKQLRDRSYQVAVRGSGRARDAESRRRPRPGRLTQPRRHGHSP